MQSIFQRIFTAGTRSFIHSLLSSPSLSIPLEVGFYFLYFEVGPFIPARGSVSFSTGVPGPSPGQKRNYVHISAQNHI